MIDADGSTRPVLDDDDIEMTQDDINVIDPFTKKRMTDPVKNKACGHIYDRESVTQLLKMNKNMRYTRIRRYLEFTFQSIFNIPHVNTFYLFHY